MEAKLIHGQTTTILRNRYKCDGLILVDDAVAENSGMRTIFSAAAPAGIKVYFFCKGFNHSKILIIDDNFCSVGSANMDIRSFEDNFEVSAIMYDPKVAEELTGYFLGDIGNSVAVTPESWENRPNLHAVYESLARLASPLL